MTFIITMHFGTWQTLRTPLHAHGYFLQQTCKELDVTKLYSRVRISQNSLLNESNKNIGEKRSESIFREVWKLAKGLQESREHVFKKKEVNFGKYSKFFDILTFPILNLYTPLVVTLKTNNCKYSENQQFGRHWRVQNSIEGALL